jgi:hypothetical protein
MGGVFSWARAAITIVVEQTIAAPMVKVSDGDSGDFNTEFTETTEKRNWSMDEEFFLRAMGVLLLF